MAIEDIEELGDAPSRFLADLRALVGHRIVRAIRYSWWPAEESARECTVANRDVFSLTAGPTLIEFDTGIGLGFSSDPSSNSIEVWMEYDEAGHPMNPEPLATDEELSPILASDPTYADDFFRQVVGARVAAISILVQAPQTVSHIHLANQVGVCFAMDSGVKMVMAHCLSRTPDDFAVIPEQAILDNLRDDLTEYSVNGPVPQGRLKRHRPFDS